MSDEYDEEYNDDKNADQNAWMYVCDEESRLVYSPMIGIRVASHLICIRNLPHIFVSVRQFKSAVNWGKQGLVSRSFIYR